jgi:hypothetical protein
MSFDSKVSRLEIDVLQLNELKDASELSVKFKLPAMVVHTQLVREALLVRGRSQGIYKIIVPVDWPKGENYGLTKLRGLPIDSMTVEGFEFMLTPNKSVLETVNEYNAIMKFVKEYLGDQIDIRFVIPVTSITDTNFDDMCSAFVGLRTPNLIRLDNVTKIQLSKASPDIHNVNIERVRSKVGYPIKISGNITSFQHITNCAGASKFAVCLQQAKVITKESMFPF